MAGANEHALPNARKSVRSHTLFNNGMNVLRMNGTGSRLSLGYNSQTHNVDSLNLATECQTNPTNGYGAHRAHGMQICRYTPIILVYIKHVQLCCAVIGTWMTLQLIITLNNSHCMLDTGVSMKMGGQFVNKCGLYSQQISHQRSREQ